MRRAVAVRPVGSWPASDEVATVTLPFTDRHRRRLRLTDDAGSGFLLDLERTVLLSHGDGLAIEGGGVIRVQAAVEPVLDIRCRSKAHAATVAWHLGNRHTPAQIFSDGAMRIAEDHVLAELLERLGAEVIPRLASFDPEPGAYEPPAFAHHHDPA